MIVKKTVFKRPYAFNEVIYLPKKFFDLPEGDGIRKAKILHEDVHARQQGKGFLRCLAWLFYYFTDKNFRRLAEAEAYANEIAFFLKNKYNVDDAGFVKILIEQYWGAFDTEQAKIVIKNGYVLAEQKSA